jgi:hypothetical protein
MSPRLLLLALLAASIGVTVALAWLGDDVSEPPPQVQPYDPYR